MTARRWLEGLGWKCLAANYRSRRGEIDLVFREGEGLVFVEVKARSRRAWVRPAGAVNARKRRLLSLAAMDYLRQVRHPPVVVRFDIVEVLLEGDAVVEVRHLPGAFSLAAPYRYG